MTFAGGRVAIAVISVLLGACGGQAATSSPSPTPVASASPSPAGVVFNILPVGGAKAVGTITVDAAASTTTIELKVAGLAPGSSHVSHIHVGSCAQRGAIKIALNQVIADGQGGADTRTTLDVKFPPAGERWYVVVHAGPDMQGTSANYLMCGDLCF